MPDRKNSWVDFIREIVILLLGILIAFQLNTCSDNRKEQQIVDRHFESLIQESEDNLGRLQWSAKHIESTENKVDSLIALIADKGSLLTINTLALDLLNVGGLYIKSSAFNTMQQTGDIRNITKYDTKSDLVSLYEYYKWIRGVEDIAIKSYEDQYYPYIAKHLDFVAGQPQSRDVYENKEFLNALGSYKYHCGARAAKYQDCIKKVESFIENYK